MPSKFDLNAKQLFLTYPHCSLDKSEALAQFKRMFDVVHYLIATESHADGSTHLHCYLKLGSNGPTRFKNPTFADLHEGHPGTLIFHGNYQGVRSASKVLTYCAKENDYISDMDVANLLRKAVKREDICRAVIQKKMTVVEAVMEHPQYLFGYSRFKLDYELFLKDSRPAPSLPRYLPNPWGWVLPTFKAVKKRHYWIYSSKPNQGKTFLFARPLRNEFGCHVETGSFLYWNVTRTTKCVILDEYNQASLSFDILNKMCDGLYPYRVFQAGCIELEDPLIIILSNQALSTLYPEKNQYDLLIERFIVKKID